MSGGELATFIGSLALVDHHSHGVAAGPLDGPAFEALLSEGGAPAPGMSNFDTPLGLALRRWCAPALGLPPHAAPQDYLARRAELGAAEAAARLLRSTRTHEYLIDTGFRSDELLDPARFAAVSGARAHEVVRLEAVAETLAGASVRPAGFADAFEAALEEATVGAIGLKSIVAYRGGFDFPPDPPAPTEVRRAAESWLGSGARRLDHPVLLRHVLWSGIRRGLPLQLHVGYGDPDLVLHRTDPSRLTGFLKLTADSGVPVLLLHCYPYHRHAAYLAAVLPHVHLDLGLAIPHVGARAAALLAETLELAPFGKLLYSSDAYGLPELYLLGATLFRRALARVLGDWLDEDALARSDAEHIARSICRHNAERVYGLGPA
ncbi:amidohydrolase family protein [Pseudonocardia asaccharolytica]|uniref:Amidohydrolase n=1 Tax=Pseudonocardia asaccharolytica DSM 44247 = NBRC 16224 TaxID=1123024 RepID=A0A511D431_9PSEU|nr:amidohydrolase family protein [Pseudonocardia asaccharolytica]GEL19417.1 amidohydrolase [Pseudonocardia asaccharolytica DSM 44247 = NBRC 16224]